MRRAAGARRLPGQLLVERPCMRLDVPTPAEPALSGLRKGLYDPHARVCGRERFQVVAVEQVVLRPRAEEEPYGSTARLRVKHAPERRQARAGPDEEGRGRVARPREEALRTDDPHRLPRLERVERVRPSPPKDPGDRD